MTAGNHTAAISWAASADTTVVEIARSASGKAGETVVYRGAGSSFTDRGLTNAVRYRYRLSAYDDAHNAVSSAVETVPTAPLHGPPAGATVVAPPLLAWKPVPKATYYNVQVLRNQRRIFSAWPSRTSIRLGSTWKYAGKRYRLAPGRYRWYVWPGFGPRAAKRYGPVLGSSTFVVVRSKRATR